MFLRFEFITYKSLKNNFTIAARFHCIMIDIFITKLWWICDGFMMKFIDLWDLWQIYDNFILSSQSLWRSDLWLDPSTCVIFSSSDGYGGISQADSATLLNKVLERDFLVDSFIILHHFQSQNLSYSFKHIHTRL